MKRRGITEETRRPATSSATIPKCENPGATPPGIEPDKRRVVYLLYHPTASYSSLRAARNTTHLPYRLTGFDSRRGRSQIFACGNRVGRCHWLAGLLGISRFPRPFIPAPLHTHLASPPSALKTSTRPPTPVDSKTSTCEQCVIEAEDTSIHLPLARRVTEASQFFSSLVFTGVPYTSVLRGPKGSNPKALDRGSEVARQWDLLLCVKWGSAKQPPTYTCNAGYMLLYCLVNTGTTTDPARWFHQVFGIGITILPLNPPAVARLPHPQNPYPSNLFRACHFERSLCSTTPICRLRFIPLLFYPPPFAHRSSYYPHSPSPMALETFSIPSSFILSHGSPSLLTPRTQRMMIVGRGRVIHATLRNVNLLLKITATQAITMSMKI
ncbi:hypothetical protein PR048_016637 [Dryococelus australis]|uniref:Uncharacterized protein n=1 Tax=Dryococelus australis TaxID=614101 RepID=A0ABQ9H792_9NEOP|nr:hypothetical protein PR048_016637 [Dryococelus australis]